MSDPVTAPIQVRATPTVAQIAAGIRVGVVALGSIAGALGYSHAFDSDMINMLSAMAGPMAGVIAFGLSQLATRSTNKKLAVTAAAAPDSVAQVK